MYIIVVGGGKIGYHTAKTLLAEGHEVLVVEKDKNRVDFICGELGSICLHGDASEGTVLADAGTSRADMLIALTGDDEDNLVACQIAKHRFKVPRTIARSTNPRNKNLFRMLGVDVTVSSTDVIMEYIEQQVPTHLITHILTFPDKTTELVEIRIPADSRIIGRRLKDIDLPEGTSLVLVVRYNEKPQPADPEMKVEPGDQIIAVMPTDSEESLKTALRGK